MPQGRRSFQNDDPASPSDLKASLDEPNSQPGVRERARQIEAEQVRLLYTQAPAGCAATVLNAGIVTVVLWKVVAHPLLLAWLALLIAIILSLFVLLRLYQRLTPTADRLRFWRTLFIIGVGFGGTVGGAAGMLLFPYESLVHQVFLVFVLGGMAAGAVAVLSPVMTAFLVVFIPTLLPITVQLFLQGDDVHVPMGFLLLSFAGVLLVMARHQQASIAESLHLRFENLDLIHHLSVANSQAEEAKIRLESLNHQNDMILQAAGEGICGLDVQGNTTFVNSAATRLTGWEAEELIDKPQHAFLHYTRPDGTFYPWSECPIYATLKRGAVHHVYGEAFWRKDGTSFPVEYTSSPIRERGEIVGAVIVFRDISERRRTEEAQLRATVAEAAKQRLEEEIAERKRIEEALRESEERWQLALRGDNDGIWDWNLKTCEMFFSPRCKEMLGFQEHEIGNHITAWAQLVHPDDIGWVTQAIKDHWAKKTPFYISEHRVRCKDGSYKWILDRGQALWDDAGNAVRMVGAHTDITERKQAEEALLRLSNAVRMSTDSIVIADLEGKIVELNEATLRMYGTTNKEDLVGKSAFEVIAPEDREEALAAIEEVLEKESINNQKYMVIVKDGSTLPVEMSVALMKNAGGNPVGFVGISRDITARKQAELALRQAKDAAEAATRAKSEFLASMSHELRTPLHVILGYSELIAEREFGPLTDEQSETLERIRRNALELHELITSVLDLSRIEAGRLPVDVKEVQVPALLEELKAETQEAYQRSKLHFGWEGEAGLAPIRTDPEKLKVVLRNLIENAVKFTPQGSITVKASPKKGGVEVSVTDTGIGIPPQALVVIFEPFRQVDSSATRQYGGAGLGLHIVKRLLELLGGTVAVESEVGRGSTFRIWIPSDRRVQPRYRTGCKFCKMNKIL